MQDFYTFIKLCFETVAPGARYYNSWHIKVIADRLQAAFYGKLNRLIINMPPRSMKSVCVSVAWPAWILAMRPESKIMVASYSQGLSDKLSLDTRCILQSEWYREMFPHVQISKDQNTKNKFQTVQRGFRFATSVGGTVTGEGGDFLIVDDPLSPLQAASEKYRQRAIDWFDQTFMTRLNNRKTGVVVLVMHRLHEQDLASHLLAKKTWDLLSIPLIAERDTKIYSELNPWKIKSNKSRKRNLIYKRKLGEVLCPKMFNKKEIEQIKNDIGSYAFTAQYQQSPISINNGLIKLSWIRRYKELPKISSCVITQSWDTANSDKKNNDNSVCTTWAHYEDGFYLLDLFKAKLDYSDLKKHFILMAERWEPSAILIENKASGQQLIQEFHKNSSLPILSCNPKDNKMTRFSQVIPIFESGRVFFPNNSRWLNDLECELFNFPNFKHDDQVDSITQYLLWAKSKTYNKLQIRVL